jgi:hypothetical protein
MRWATTCGNWRGAKVLLRCSDRVSDTSFVELGGVALRSAGACAALVWGAWKSIACHRDGKRNTDLLAYAVEAREREWK